MSGRTTTSSSCRDRASQALIQQYAQFLDQQRTLRRAMTDYFAGQQFFEFYTGEFEAAVHSSSEEA